MQLPKNFMDIAGAFEGLSPDRKKQIVEHFAHLPEESRQATYSQFQANGGPEAEFVKAIFEQRPAAPAKPSPAPQAAPKLEAVAKPSEGKK